MSNYPEGTTPKNIALQTRLNVNTVKSILPKIPGIQKVMRGFYKVVKGGDGGTKPQPDALRDWTFHNAVLSCQLDDYPNSFYEYKESLGLIAVSLFVSRLGRATFRVTSDYPLNVSALSLAYGMLSVCLKKVSSDSVSTKDVLIRTIEFNKDYSNLRMDGIKCITVDSLCQQFKVYQKKQGMRIEHKTKVPFTVENIIEMLQSNPHGLEHNLKLSSMKRLLDRQVVATQANTTMLYKLIENIKEGE